MIGSKLGPYELIEEIGRGGMATVYRAYQPNVDRFVAVKVIHQAIALDSKLLDRFTREARLVAKLEHPHILPVYDYDGHNDPPYIVMRYLPTGTLKDILEREQLPYHEVAYLMGQIGAALDYAHRQGVIHRDIKPSNIMVDADGNAFLTDFGIARMVESTDGLTGTGMAIGTPGYMSPEQGLGTPIDGRADIYSLGAMLYEMLSGKVPFKAETPMAVILKHINDPVPEITEIRPDLPLGVNGVIMKAMAKKPEDRYQTANELSRALNASLGSLRDGSPEVLQAAATMTINELAETRKRKSQTVVQAPVGGPPGGTPPPNTPIATSTPAMTPPPGAVTLTFSGSAAKGALVGAGMVVVLALLVLGILFLIGNKNSSDATSTAQALALAASLTQTTPAPGATTPPAATSTKGGTAVVGAGSNTPVPPAPTTQAPTRAITQTPDRNATATAQIEARNATRTAIAVSSYTATSNVQTIVAEVIAGNATQTAQAIASFTATPTPTRTPIPPTSTFTPSPTLTPTSLPTLVPTFTPTSMPIPPTATFTTVPATTAPAGTAVAMVSTSLPYLNDMESPTALDGWDFDPNAWKLQTDSGNVALVGQGGETSPVVVRPQASSAWEDPGVQNLLIALRMNVNTTSSIGRVAFRFTEGGGYYVFEMSPGFISLKRGAAGKTLSRGKERTLGQARAPINAGTWHDVLIWTDISRTFVYFDRQLYLMAQDTQDSLPGGTILFQSVNSRQRVSFDNVKVQLPLAASQHFEGSDWPNTWMRTSPSTATIANDGQGNNFVSVTSGDVGPVMQPPVPDMMMACRILSTQGGLDVHFQESPEGSYRFHFEAGNMTLSQLDKDGKQLQNWAFPDFYAHGNFFTFIVETVGNEIRLYDGKDLFSQKVKTPPPAGGIRFSAGPGDLFSLDDCLLSEATKSATEDAAWAFDKITQVLARPSSYLLTDWPDHFTDRFQTKDWWVGGADAPGDYIYNKTDPQHTYYLEMTYKEGASWRIFRTAPAFYAFGAGRDTQTFFDSSDVFLRMNVRIKSGTAWIAARTSVSTGRGTLNGYRVELTKAADGSYTVTARSYSLAAPQVYWQGPLPPQPDGTIPEWITLLVITYHDKAAMFANGRLIASVSNTSILDGTVAFGVEPGSTADFHDFQLKDVSPETR